MSGVYAVVDLYGLCAQVSITGGSVIRPADTQVVVTTAVDTTEQSSSPSVLKSGMLCTWCLSTELPLVTYNFVSCCVG